jgi:hypothetical protein
MRTADDLDTALRRLGYYLQRARPHRDAPRRRWRVASLSGDASWDCDDLEEVRSLLRALGERDARGRRGVDIIWDGQEWVCVEVD